MNSRRLAAIAGVIVALAFWRAFGLWRFYDDWVFVGEAHHALATRAIASFIWLPLGQHWSPLWHAFEMLNLWSAGWSSDWLIRGTIALMVLAGLVLLGRLASRLGASPLATSVAMCILGFHHLNAVAYYSFDTYSQVGADLCSWVVVSLFLTFGLSRRPLSARSLVTAVVLYAPSLLIKEQALSALAGAILVVLWFTWIEPLEPRRLRMLWTALSVMFGWSIAFTLLRRTVGVPISATGAFQLCPACVPGNIGLMLGGLLLPFRTMTAYLALINPTAQIGWVLIAAVGVSTVLAAAIFGLSSWWRTNHDRQRLVLLVALVVASLFPTALLTHVGELYAHTALFWFSMVMALVVDGWRARVAAAPPSVRRLPTLAAVVTVAYVAMLFAGLRGNLGEMRATGERVRSLQIAFNRAVGAVSAGTVVVVRGLEEAKGSLDYSLYRLTTSGMLLGDSGALRFTADPALTIVDEADWLERRGSTSASGVLVADFTGGQPSVRSMSVHRP